MDKKILEDYIDACAFIKDTEAENARLEKKKRYVQDKVRGSNPDWPYEERMPERDKTVLACQCGGAIDVAWHDGYRWKTGFSHADWLRDVAAWRPLPEPYRPKK